MNHLVWCGISICISVLSSFILRLVVYRVTKSRSIHTLYDEFIGNFVAAVIVMELSVLSYAQHSTYFFITCLYVYLFIKNLYFSVLGLYGTPLSFIDLYYSKNRKHEFTLVEVCTILLSQTAASLAGISYAKLLWMYEDAVHQNLADESCLSTISDSHLWYECFAVEMFGVFICAFVDFCMYASWKVFTRPLMTILVINNLSHVTGTWMNPMLATVFTFRCSGHISDALHFIVYWVAPFVGLFIAWEFHLLVQKFISSTKGSTKDDKKKTN